MDVMHQAIEKIKRKGLAEQLIRQFLAQAGDRGYDLLFSALAHCDVALHTRQPAIESMNTHDATKLLENVILTQWATTAQMAEEQEQAVAACVSNGD